MKKLPIILTIMAMLFISIAMATPTIVFPASTSVKLTGTYTFNATTALVNSANCTFTIASAAKTANTTSVSMGTYVNTSAGQLINFSVVYNTALLEDGTDYVITVACKNETGSSETGVFSGYTVDNTVPVAASSLSPAAGVRVSTDGQLFSGTVTGARTTACTLRIGQNSYAMTHTGNTCTYTTKRSDPSAGQYNWYIIASDGTNSTNSATQSVWVEGESNSGAVIQQQLNQEQAQVQQTQQQKNTRTILIIAVIAFVVYLLFFKDKKKGRR